LRVDLSRGIDPCLGLVIDFQSGVGVAEMALDVGRAVNQLSQQRGPSGARSGEVFIGRRRPGRRAQLTSLRGRYKRKRTKTIEGKRRVNAGVRGRDSTMTTWNRREWLAVTAGRW
jgi:hypothetical protein